MRSAFPASAVYTWADLFSFHTSPSRCCRWKAAKRGAKLTPVESAVGGALSAVAAQSVSTPLDVARTRIMTQPEDALRMNPVQCIRQVAREEGIRGLYAGVSPKALRAVLSGAIQFSTYEATKEFTNKLLGVRRR